DVSQLAADSHSAAIDRIEMIVKQEAIDCDFERLPGYLFPTPDEDLSSFDKEFEAAHRAGLTSVTKVDRAPLADFNTGPALLFPRQGQLHAGKYLLGLAPACSRYGARIFTSTHVTAFEGGENANVTTQDGHTIKA